MTHRSPVAGFSLFKALALQAACCSVLALRTFSEVLVTFDPPPVADDSTPIFSYAESGVVLDRGLSDPCYHVDSGSSGLLPDNGTGFLDFPLGSDSWFVEMDGSLFDAKRVDLAEYSTALGGRASVTFRGTRLDRSTVSVTFVTDGVIDGTGPQNDFQTFTFPASFTNLVRLDIPSSGFALDNLALSLSPGGSITYSTLTVVGARGSDTFGNGAHRLVTGQTLTATVAARVVEGDTLYVCKGAAVEGAEFSSSAVNSLSIPLVQDATLTWLWEALPRPPTTDIRLTFDPPSLPHGSRCLDTYDQLGVHFGGTLSGSYTHTDNGFEGRPDNGSAYLTVSRAYTYFDLGGKTFSVRQIDLAEYSSYYAYPSTSTFKGIRADGSAVFASFNVDGVMDGTGPLADFETFAFPDTFANLVKVEFVAFSATLPTMDNLILTPAGGSTLSTRGAPAAFGVARPYGYGSDKLPAGTVVTNRVDPVADDGNGVRHICRGWTGTGNIPAAGTGTLAVAAITRNSTITWKWAAQYRLAACVRGQGTLLSAAEWHDPDAQAVLTACAAPGSSFSGWLGDTNGCALTGATITVPMTKPRALTAVFTEIPFEPATNGLVLWNRLGSEAEVHNSVVGSNGLAFAGTFVPGVFGSALEVTAHSQMGVSFPLELLPRNAGCIEFWAKVAGVPASIQAGSPVSLACFSDSQGSTYPLMHFNGNDGTGNGGLCGGAWGIGSVGTGTFGGWSFAEALKGASIADWHHYAIAWSIDVLPGLTNPVRRVAIYVDGALNSGYWGVANNPPYPEVPLSGQLGLVYLQTGSAAVDNLKVWSVAKTDFSDRFAEGPVMAIRSLTVSGSRGAGTPGDGSHAYADGDSVSATVASPVTEDGTRYVCAGAAVEGCAFAPSGQTRVTLTLTNDASVTWNWQTQHRLTVTSEGQGAVTHPALWHHAGAEVKLTATPLEGWFLDRWEGDVDGCAMDGAAITLLMDRARAVTAVFVQTVVTPFDDFTRLPENVPLALRSLSGVWWHANNIRGLSCDAPSPRGSAAFQASVSGPGILSFEWDLDGADGTNTLACSVGWLKRLVKQTAGATAAAVAVPYGAQNVSWKVTRGARSPETRAIVRNLRWTPLESAADPAPANGGTVLQRAFSSLAWGGDADQYRVYAGQSPSSLKRVAETACTSVPSTAVDALVAAARGMPFYWRVDAVRLDSAGVEALRTGPVWNLTVLPSGAPELPAGASLSGAFTVGVRVDSGALPIDCGLAGNLTCKTVTGSIPPGLKISVADGALRLTGIPTRPGSYPATVQLTLRNGTKTVWGSALRLDLTVSALDRAAGTFDGWAENSLYGEGLAKLTVTAQGRISGKLTLRGTNYTFRADCFDGASNGWLTVGTVARNGSKAALTLRLAVTREGAVAGAFTDEPQADLALVRNRWKEPGMTAVLEQVDGTYAVALPDGGAATLTLTRCGTACVEGRTAENKPYTSSAALLHIPGDTTSPDRCFVVMCAITSSSRGPASGIFGLLEVVLAPEANQPNSLAEVIPLRGW